MPVHIGNHHGRAIGLILFVMTTVLLGCSTETSTSEASSTSNSAAAAGSPSASTSDSVTGDVECVDDGSANLDTQDLIDLGLLAEGYRGIASPILDHIPSGGYADFVAAVCPTIPPGDSDWDELTKVHGGLAKKSFETCLGAVGGNVKVDEAIARFTAAVPDDPQFQAYLAALWHGAADHICPQYFVD
jgi:hypothetical protein